MNEQEFVSKKIAEDLIINNKFNETDFALHFKNGISASEGDFAFQLALNIIDEMMKCVKQNPNETFLIKNVLKINTVLKKLHDSHFAYGINCLMIGLKKIPEFLNDGKIKAEILKEISEVFKLSSEESWVIFSKIELEDKIYTSQNKQKIKM